MLEFIKIFTRVLSMKESNERHLSLSVNFHCLYREDFEVNVELIDANRMQGLQDAWDKAIEQYCPNNIQQMKKQLKRKLGSIYNFHDQSDVVLHFLNANGKRDEIRVTTDYT